MKPSASAAGCRRRPAWGAGRPRRSRTPAAGWTPGVPRCGCRGGPQSGRRRGRARRARESSAQRGPGWRRSRRPRSGARRGSWPSGPGSRCASASRRAVSPRGTVPARGWAGHPVAVTGDQQLGAGAEEGAVGHGHGEDGAVGLAGAQAAQHLGEVQRPVELDRHGPRQDHLAQRWHREPASAATAVATMSAYPAEVHGGRHAGDGGVLVEGVGQARVGGGPVLPDHGVEELVGGRQRRVGRPDRGGPTTGHTVGVARDAHGEAGDDEQSRHGVGEGQGAQGDDARAEIGPPRPRTRWRPAPRRPRSPRPAAPCPSRPGSVPAGRRAPSGCRRTAARRARTRAARTRGVGGRPAGSDRHVDRRSGSGAHDELAEPARQRPDADPREARVAQQGAGARRRAVGRRPNAGR